MAQGGKVDIILKFVFSWLCLCFSSAFRDVLWVCVSFHTLVDLVRFVPPFFLMWGSHLVWLTLAKKSHRISLKMNSPHMT